MKLSGSKKITAIFAALASAIAITGLAMKNREEHHECSCADAGCDCGDTFEELHVPEPSVQKVSRVKKLGTRKANTDSATGMRTTEVLKDMFNEIKGKTLPNESIATIIMSLINLQNAVKPDDAIDIRNIHFMKYGKQNHMVIDLYTAHFGAPRYEEELHRLWHDVFLAEDFWNADFVKVRVTAKDKKSGDTLETISCNLDDVRRYLLKQSSIEEFQASWTRKPAKSGKASDSNSPSNKPSRTSSGDKKLGKLKRA
ncbi:MAG: hypothetical protein ACYC56_12885 [Candidatus Aquicultor sp.]